MEKKKEGKKEKKKDAASALYTPGSLLYMESTA